jgi:CHAT domain-containing protein
VAELIRKNKAANIRLCLILCGVMLVGVSEAAQTVPYDVNNLELGKPIERELHGGETHAYRIHLSAGQFVNVTVNQEDIDVTVKLLGPENQEVVITDSPNGRNGPEQLTAIAQTTADYRLEVSAPDKAAPSGHYKIMVVSLREATPPDRELVAAEAAFSEAYLKLRPQRTSAARRTAIEKFQGALRYFQASRDQYRQAWTLYMIGVLHAESGEFKVALDYASQTMTLFRSIGDRAGEGSALNLLGGMSDVLGDLPGALNYYGQALSRAREGKCQSREASILNNIGKAYNDLNDWQKAIEYYQQVLPLDRATRNPRLEAITLHNIGLAYSSLGEFEKALDYLQQALPLRRSAADKAGEADTLTNIGSTYNLLGRPHEALVYFNQALPLRVAVGDRRGEGITLDFIGVAYSLMGEPAKALGYHQQALERHRAAESRRSEAITLGNIAHVYTQFGETQKSLEFHRQALTLFRTIGDRQNEAKMLQGLARAERDNGNLTEARKDMVAALSLTEALRANVSGQQLRSSYFSSKQEAYGFYIDLLMQLHSQNPSAGLDAEALQTSERARARSLLDLVTEARVDIRQGVEPALLEKERNLGQLLNTKAQRKIQLLGQKGTEQRLADLNKEIGELEDQYQQTQSAIRKASPGYAALTQPQPLGLKEIQQQLDAGTLLLEYSLGAERSYVWAITPNSLTTRELPKRDEIEKAARPVYELLTARSLFRPREPISQRQERIALADSQLREASRRLSQMVLGPVASEMGSKRLVVVADGALQYIPFAALPTPSVVSSQLSVPERRTGANKPLTTERATGKPLIVDHEVISLPSASALAVQRVGMAGRKLAPKGVAVIADPVFSLSDERFKQRLRTAGQSRDRTDASASTRIIEHLADDSGNLVIRRLRFTREEADQILAVAPRATNLRAIDFKANRATATSGELSKYRYVHFATHGYLDSERPDLSAVVLSLVDEQGNPQDGFLRAREIYNLNLPAELVVLSACQTGLGKEIKGEGLVGLTRGFMYAGARRVVVSLWNVNDKATAELMRRFYRKILKDKQSPAASLRSAQIEMWQQKQWQSPYYWAPFVLQGEWK